MAVLDGPREPPFQGFTRRALIVIALAGDECEDFGHARCDVGYLVLGMLREGHGVAGIALESEGISFGTCREAVAEMGVPGEPPPLRRPVPMTPTFQSLLQGSLYEAFQLGHSYVGTEHLLLAVVRLGESGDSRISMLLGTDFDRLRGRVYDLLGGIPEPHPPPAQRWPATNPGPAP